MLNLNNEISRIGVCEQWQSIITGGESPQRLLQLLSAHEQVREWSIKHDWPSLERWRAHRALALKYNVMVDSVGSLENAPYVMTIGSSAPRLIYSDFAVARIDARHDSVIRITARDNAMVRVNLYDRARIEAVDKSDNAQIKIYERR